MRHWLAVGMISGLALLVSGCGFTPMYGDDGMRFNPAADLSNFDVQIPRDRTAQLVRNELLRTVPPAAIGAAPYVLQLTVKKEDAPLLITSGSLAKQMRLRLKTKYALYRRDGKKPLATGETFADAPYVTTREHLASEHARMQAERAAARKVAEDIRRRLAVFFAGQKGR